MRYPEFRLKIALDMDEVMCQFVQKVLDRWNRINGTEFVREDISVWQMEKTLALPEHQESCKKIVAEWIDEPGFFEDLEWMPGAERVAKKLAADPRFELSIVTSIGSQSDGEPVKGKTAWLKKNFPEFDRKRLFISSTKQMINVDFLVDDGIHNLQKVDSICNYSSVLFDAPWNRQTEELQTYFRVKDWSDLENFIEAADKGDAGPWWCAKGDQMSFPFMRERR